ncbi:protein mono-ADP-ribosyltransferase Parp16-like [Teleopsis dalmanni]|uniref:protein mono-ADP-ribosyltransferase Parp16-like n=1 Tax=Teleopsis dalmanni TaxID=139649 RepID=UPI0018CEF2BB|nr:protein mono-ADP-ribosyltransferase Parp16-like [Teleopsis dalmanni]
MDFTNRKYLQKCCDGRYSDGNVADCEASDANELVKKSKRKSFPIMIHQLMQMFDIDIIGCDGKWSLFVAAASSHRWKELLIPIPPFKSGSTFDIKWLLQVIKETPKFSTLYDLILKRNCDVCERYVIELLYIVLLTMSEPNFHMLKPYKLQTIIGITYLNMNEIRPTHAFEMRFANPAKQEEKFESVSSNFCRKFGFYGAPPSEFYSILFNGFLSKEIKRPTNEENAEVKQIHLTTDLSVSLTHSVAEPSWSLSTCGAVLRSVAICEYIERPDCVHVRKDADQEHTDIFISKGEVIRVRHMLFFGEEIPSLQPDGHIEYVEEIINGQENEPPKQENVPLEQENNPLEQKTNLLEQQNNLLEEENKTNFLAIGCCAVAGISLFFMYKRNILGLRTFIECKCDEFIDELVTWCVRRE